jgi:hypothetical protein
MFSIDNSLRILLWVIERRKNCFEDNKTSFQPKNCDDQVTIHKVR